MCSQQLVNLNSNLNSSSRLTNPDVGQVVSVGEQRSQAWIRNDNNFHKGTTASSRADCSNFGCHQIPDVHAAQKVLSYQLMQSMLYPSFTLCAEPSFLVCPYWTRAASAAACRLLAVNLSHMGCCSADISCRHHQQDRGGAEGSRARQRQHKR